MDGWIVKNGVQDNHLDRVGRLPNELIRRHLSTEERRLEKASEGSDGRKIDSERKVRKRGKLAISETDRGNEDSGSIKIVQKVRYRTEQ